MEEFKELLENITESIDKASKLLLQQKESEATEILLNIIDMLNMATEVLFSNIEELSEIGINVDKDKLLEDLNEILNGVECKDFVLVSDILTYEVKETLEGYIKQITKVLQ